jgi:ParB family chromosome partitioning protein
LLGGKTPGAPGPSSTVLPEARAERSGADGADLPVRRVPLDSVKASSLQPRRFFPDESLAELAQSIREQGVLQPLVVRKRNDVYELIAGERRWRAARQAGLNEVPVIVREADDATVLQWMLVENLQREDLNPMDEAQGYAELMERFGFTQETVAAKVGRSRAVVANALRLLKLPREIQGLLQDGRLSTGHAKVLLGLPSATSQVSTAERVVNERLSVRQAEELVSMLTTAPAPARTRATPAATVRDPHVQALEDQLRDRLGTRVHLRYRQGRGQIDIRFFSDAELERVLEIVGVQPG